VPQSRLRNPKSAVEVQRQKRQDGPRRNRRQAITEDERPEAALRRIRPGKFRRSLFNLRKERRPRDRGPQYQPRYSERAGHEERCPPSISQAEWNGYQGGGDATECPTAKGQGDRSR